MARAAAAPAPLPYRPEIDGLRALAIVPVVMFHAGVPGFRGGFAGVDVFFVISGYLITGILTHHGPGGIDFVRFYERRARRIIPALLLVLAATLVGAWWLMIPNDFDQFSKSLAATALFASNLLFARGNDYFYTGEGFAPLLHTWSLSVEEQFYLLYPALIALILRVRPRALPLVIGAGIVMGFAGALITQQSSPLLAFYMMPTRLWELLLGALCSCTTPRLSARAAGAAAWAGIGAIAAGFAVLQPGSAVPGPALLLPTLGTAAVLWCGTQHAAPGRLLSWRPLQLIGLISYGLYLWHVPLLAFVHYQWLRPPPAWIAAAVAVSFVLAILSWRLIESPVRRRDVLGSRPALAATCIAGLGLATMIGAAGHAGVIGSRLATQNARLDGTFAAQGVPDVVAGTAPVRFVLYGDSHARQYFPSLSRRLGPGALLSQSACLSLPHASNSTESGDAAACSRRFAQFAAEAARTRAPLVIWAQRWERSITDDLTGRPLGTTGVGTGAGVLYRELSAARAALPASTRLILLGSSPTAWVLGPPMGAGYLRCQAYHDASCPASYPEDRAEGRAANAVLKHFAAATPGVLYVDAAAQVCPAGKCIVSDGQHLYYSDGSHFTAFAADKVGAAVTAAIESGAE